MRQSTAIAWRSCIGANYWRSIRLSKLKASYLQGAAWDLEVQPLLEAVELLSTTEGIAQASLHGDRAHVIVKPGEWTAERLKERLSEKGIGVESIVEVESSLEDVFTLLAHS